MNFKLIPINLNAIRALFFACLFLYAPLFADQAEEKNEQNWMPDLITEDGQLNALAGILGRHPGIAMQNLTYHRNLMDAIRPILELTKDMEDPNSLEFGATRRHIVEYIPGVEWKENEEAITKLQNGLKTDFTQFRDSGILRLKSLREDLETLKELSGQNGLKRAMLAKYYRLLPFLYDADGNPTIEEIRGPVSQAQIELLIERAHRSDLSNRYGDLLPVHLAPIIDELASESGYGKLGEWFTGEIINKFVPKTLRPAIKPIRSDGEQAKSRSLSIETVPPLVAVMRGCLGGDCSIRSVPYYALIGGSKTYFVRRSKTFDGMPDGYVFAIPIERDGQILPFIITINGISLSEEDTRTLIRMVAKDWGVSEVIVPDFSKQKHLVNYDDTRAGMRYKNGEKVSVSLPIDWPVIQEYTEEHKVYGNYYHKNFLKEGFLVKVDTDHPSIINYTNASTDTTPYTAVEDFRQLSIIERSLLAAQMDEDQDFSEAQLRYYMKKLSLNEAQVKAGKILLHSRYDNPIDHQKFVQLKESIDFKFADLAYLDPETRAASILTLRAHTHNGEHATPQQWDEAIKSANDKLSRFIRAQDADDAIERALKIQARMPYELYRKAILFYLRSETSDNSLLVCVMRSLRGTRMADDPEVRQAISWLINEKDLEIAGEAAKALAKLGTKNTKAQSLLLDLLKNAKTFVEVDNLLPLFVESTIENPKLQIRMLKILTNLFTKISETELEESSSEEKAVERIPDKIDSVYQRIRAKHPSVQKYLVEAIVHRKESKVNEHFAAIAVAVLSRSPRLSITLQWELVYLLKRGDSKDSDNASTVLSKQRVTDPEIQWYLYELLKQGDEHIRKAATKVLKASPIASAALKNKLLEMARNGATTDLRGYAAEILVANFPANPEVAQVIIDLATYGRTSRETLVGIRLMAKLPSISEREYRFLITALTSFYDEISERAKETLLTLAPHDRNIHRLLADSLKVDNEQSQIRVLEVLDKLHPKDPVVLEAIAHQVRKTPGNRVSKLAVEVCTRLNIHSPELESEMLKILVEPFPEGEDLDQKALKDLKLHKISILQYFKKRKNATRAVQLVIFDMLKNQDILSSYALHTLEEMENLTPDFKTELIQIVQTTGVVDLRNGAMMVLSGIAPSDRTLIREALQLLQTVEGNDAVIGTYVLIKAPRKSPEMVQDLLRVVQNRQYNIIARTNALDALRDTAKSDKRVFQKLLYVLHLNELNNFENESDEYVCKLLHTLHYARPQSAEVKMALLEVSANTDSIDILLTTSLLLKQYEITDPKELSLLASFMKSQGSQLRTQVAEVLAKNEAYLTDADRKILLDARFTTFSIFVPKAIGDFENPTREHFEILLELIRQRRSHQAAASLVKLKPTDPAIEADMLKLLGAAPVAEALTEMGVKNIRLLRYLMPYLSIDDLTTEGKKMKTMAAIQLLHFDKEALSNLAPSLGIQDVEHAQKSAEDFLRGSIKDNSIPKGIRKQAVLAITPRSEIINSQQAKLLSLVYREGNLDEKREVIEMIEGKQSKTHIAEKLLRKATNHKDPSINEPAQRCLNLLAE